MEVSRTIDESEEWNEISEMDLVQVVLNDQIDL